MPSKKFKKIARLDNHKELHLDLANANTFNQSSEDGGQNTHHVSVWHGPKTCHVNVGPHFSDTLCKKIFKKEKGAEHKTQSNASSQSRETDYSCA